MVMIKEYIINQHDVVLVDLKRFHIKLYTTKIQEYELTLGEIINLVRAEIKQMKEANKRRGFKLRYTLWPISLLTQISNNIRLNELHLVSTSSSTLETLIQQRDLLEIRFTELHEISDYMQNYANFINDKVLYDVRNTKVECEKIYKNLQSKYRDFIIFIRHGDKQKGLELWSDIEADYNYLIQQLGVLLSGDQESFFNKIHYIHYLTQRQVSYLGKNINFGKKQITLSIVKTFEIFR